MPFGEYFNTNFALTKIYLFDVVYDWIEYGRNHIYQVSNKLTKYFDIIGHVIYGFISLD